MDEFQKLVKQMREAQKTYFKTSPSPAKQAALTRSKELEKQVDQYLKDKEGKPDMGQTNLF